MSNYSVPDHFVPSYYVHHDVPEEEEEEWTYDSDRENSTPPQEPPVVFPPCIKRYKVYPNQWSQTPTVDYQLHESPTFEYRRCFPVQPTSGRKRLLEDFLIPIPDQVEGSTLRDTDHRWAKIYNPDGSYQWKCLPKNIGYLQQAMQNYGVQPRFISPDADC
jgi:hypothetical protein